jgi:arabinan endo-1,5-alpha-L-arabinosidase
MNGNRWIGTGHNSVFRDRDGQWWTVYHAVDRRDPYFQGEPGFTKRPALLDPLTWRHGWPSVRAGRWASDHRMPAPAAQPGERSNYRPRPVAAQRTGRLLDRFSDGFSGSLERRWSWVREPDASTFGVSGGRFNLDVQTADLARQNTPDETTNNASVLVRPAPRRDFVVETKVALDVPADGVEYNYAQAGLVLYRNDDAYVKLVHASIWETRQTEWAKEVPHAPAEYPRYGNGVVGPPGDLTSLRIVVDRRRGPDRYTAWTRQDHRAWVRGGTWIHQLGPRAEVGLVSMGGSGYTARFLDVRAWKLR